MAVLIRFIKGPSFRVSKYKKICLLTFPILGSLKNTMVKTVFQNNNVFFVSLDREYFQNIHGISDSRVTIMMICIMCTCQTKTSLTTKRSLT